jgi:hypothetical protein
MACGASNSPMKNVALLLLAACGSSTPASSPDAPAASPTIQLRTTPFMQPPGETYHCWYFKPDAPAGTAIASFHPVTSAAVHHLALFFQPGGTVQPDATCNGFGPWSLLWGAGVGTGDTVFPPGVAVPARTDGVYILQVHIRNSSDQTVSIEAGVDLSLTTDAFTRAGMFLAGNTQFTVPAHALNFTVTTDCAGRLPDGAHVVGLFPHMHQLGARFQVDVSGQHVYDQPWQFDAQTLAMFDPQPTVASTATIEMRCIYDNPGDAPVSFGLSTTDEMCFGAFYYTPATRDEIDCVH